MLEIVLITNFWGPSKSGALGSAVAGRHCPSRNAYRGPPNGDLVFDVMLHLEAEWPSKQNILIADTILTESGM